MRHSDSIFSKLIAFQLPVCFSHNETVFSRKDPFIAFFEADTTVTFSDRSELRYNYIKFECATVAVSMIYFEFGRGSPGRGHLEIRVGLLVGDNKL